MGVRRSRAVCSAVVAFAAALSMGAGTRAFAQTTPSAGPSAQASAPSLSLGSSTLGNIFTIGSRAKVTVSSSAPQLSWKVKDIFGNPVESGSSATSSLNGALTLKISDPGYYTLTVTATSGDSSTAKSTNLAILRETSLSTAAMTSRVGVSTHYTRSANTWKADSIPLIAKAGLGHARDNATWGAFEPKDDGKYVYPTKVKTTVDDMKSHGISIDPILGGNNAPYPYVGSKSTDKGRVAYAKYANYVVTQMRSIDPDTAKDTNSYQVWNEWNHLVGSSSSFLPCGGDQSDPEQLKAIKACLTGANYYNTLKTVHDTVKADHSGAQLNAGAIAGYDGAWFTDLFDAGSSGQKGYDMFDSVSFTTYPKTPEKLIANLDDLHNRMEKASGSSTVKPIRLSEIGYATGGTRQYTFSELTAAEYTARTIAIALSKGVQGVTLYDLVDDGTDPDNREHHLGLLRNASDPRGKYVPKPAYVAVSNIDHQLAGRTPKGLSTIGSSGYDAAFSGNNGSTQHVLWSTTDGLKVTVSASEPVTYVDMVGRSKKVSPVNGKVSLTLKNAPIYIGGKVSSITTQS